METISSVLSRFEPISLSEMDSIRLMNRIDTKFVFPVKLLPQVLAEASKLYRILEIKGQRDMKYTTTYYDSCNYGFFVQHARNKLNRYKVRYRTYENTKESFLEVKCKTIKNRTVKWRIQNKLIDNSLDIPAIDFLATYIDDMAYGLSPVLTNRFHRLTLACRTSAERVTIDFDLSFADNDGKVVELPYVGIAEVKKDGFKPSPLATMLRKMGVHNSGFSKYCIGSALLRPMSKTNFLKPKLLMLQKIKNENYSSVYA